MDNQEVIATKISVVSKEAVIDESKVDLVHTVETKKRTTVTQLKAKKQYLETNIAKWQADLAETDALINQVYAELEK